MAKQIMIYRHSLQEATKTETNVPATLAGRGSAWAVRRCVGRVCGLRSVLAVASVAGSRAGPRQAVLAATRQDYYPASSSRSRSYEYDRQRI